MARGDAQPIVLQRNWSKGQRRYPSRDAIGGNAAWRIKDYIVDRLGAPLEKRGGWGYSGSTFSGSPTKARAIADAPMNGGHYLLAVTSTGQVYRTTNSPSSPPATWAIDGTTATVGPLLQNPYFFEDTLVFPAKDSSSSLYIANETTVVPYTDCAVTHRPTYITGWKNRMVGASGEHVIFGPPIGSSGTVVGVAWDDDADYAVDQPIKGIHAIRNAIYIWHDGSIERMRGTTPAGYGVTDDDIIREDAFGQMGLIDAFSLVPWRSFVVWADRRGIYLTDGGAPVDLTWLCGIKNYWSNFMDAYASTWRVAGGIVDDLYVVTIYDTNDDTEKLTVVIDLPSRVAYEFTNFVFTAFAYSAKDRNESFACVGNANGKVAKLHQILVPADANKQDANGVDVLPSIEGSYARFGAGPQRLLDAYVGYEIINPSSGTPPTFGLSWSVKPDPDLASYTTYGDGTESFGASTIHGATDTGYHYHRVSLRAEGAGFTWKLVQTNASAHTRLYNISLSFIPLPGTTAV